MVVRPDTGLTTVVKLTKTNGPANSDANVGAELVTTDATVAAEDHLEVLGDSAYATGDMLHTLHGKVDAAAQALADQARSPGRIHHRRLRP